MRFQEKTDFLRFQDAAIYISRKSLKINATITMEGDTLIVVNDDDDALLSARSKSYMDGVQSSFSDPAFSKIVSAEGEQLKRALLGAAIPLV
jgi:hypothetical protein